MPALHRPSSRHLTGWVATLLSLAVPLSTAIAGDAAPEGTTALLQMTIEIEGAANRTGKYGEYHNWSTKRSVTFETTLVADKPSVDSPGGPGMPPVAAALPADQTMTPSSNMEAMAAEMEKCGDNTACQMALAMKMAQDPKFQADATQAQSVAKAVGKSQARKPRFQMWMVKEVPSNGAISIQETNKTLFKTAVNEISDCKQSGQATIKETFPGGTVPAFLTVDVETGAFSLRIPSQQIFAQTELACVNLDGKVRSERHEQQAVRLMPETYSPALAEPGVFTGTGNAAANGQQLAHGNTVLTGIYGNLSIDNAPKTAKISVRWTVTRKG